MSETPNRYGAHSSEQEQWVLDGELHSGSPTLTPARQGEYASQAPAQSPSALSQPTLPANNASGGDFASFENQNSHPYSPGGEYSVPDSFPEPKNKFPIPPGYGNNDSQRAPSGISGLGESGNLGPGSFSGLGDHPETPPRNPKSRAVPITVLVLGIVLMLVVAPITFVTMLGVFKFQIDASVETHKGESSITRTADYQGTSMVIVEASDGSDVRCDATFNGEKIDSLSGDNSLFSGFATDPDREDQHTFVYHLHSHGTFKVECESLGDKDATISEISMLPNFTYGLFIAAFVVPTIIGFMGIGVLIWGIVWMAKRSRENREALISASYYR